VPAGRYTSLLDDPRFLAELERIDIPIQPGARMPVVTAGDALAVLPDLVDADWSSRHPKFISEAAPASPGWSTGRIVLASVGFLLMMGIGGAAATVVFHARVARMLAQRPISAASASLPATDSTPR
jgi:hypothetical protein